MKRLLACLLAFSLVAFGMTFAVAEEEKTEEYISGDWKYTVQEDGTAVIVKYSGDASELKIPDQLEGKTVMGIGDRAFLSCKSLTSVTIPDSVTSVVSNPFIGCIYLSEINVSPDHPYLANIDGVLFSKPDKRLLCYPVALITESYEIPQGIKEIGASAFTGCKFLSVTIPDSVTIIVDRAFSSCSSMTSVTIPDSVTSIGDMAFAGCKSMASITIPDSVTSIGENPFVRCKQLLEINVSPDHPYLANIDGVLFSKPDKRLVCYPGGLKAESYEIPQGIKEIGNSAVYGCDSLTSVTIPDSVTSIGDGAFAGCKSLTSVIIPDSVTSIGDGVFSSCGSLTTVTIPDSVTSIGKNAFEGCASLISVIIPDSVTSIGDRAFWYCESLTSITIPDSVTSIGILVFANCTSLTTITIPDSVTSIGNNAFADCGSLTCTVGRDSYAKQYCEEKGIKYTYADALDWLND